MEIPYLKIRHSISTSFRRYSLSPIYMCVARFLVGFLSNAGRRHAEKRSIMIVICLARHSYFHISARIEPSRRSLASQHRGSADLSDNPACCLKRRPGESSRDVSKADSSASRLHSGLSSQEVCVQDHRDLRELRSRRLVPSSTKSLALRLEMLAPEPIRPEATS